MAHLSRETAGEIISGDTFASLNIVEMALIRKALKGIHPAGGTLKPLHGENRAMILKFECAPKSSGNSGSLGWAPRVGISNKFPGDADDALQGPHFQKQWARDSDAGAELSSVCIGASLYFF